MVEPQIFRTKAAAAYLSSNGVQMSLRTLEKLRARGEEDTRDRGPDFYRDEQSTCWYTREALEAYIDKRIAARQFRGRSRQPANFKGRAA
jgi:hypothetical protein